MARIVFVQQLAEEWLGVMYISAMLKSHGHQCDVYVEPLEQGDVVDAALAGSPDVVAFSCLTSDFHWALGKARAVKRRSDAVTIFGGTHIALNAEEAIRQPEVDITCQGEGEYPMLELADALDKGQDPAAIPGLWVKQNGSLVKNELRPLIDDLDSLPHPDRALYARYPFFQVRGKRPLHLSRGCPYECSYCHNESKKALFKGQGRYVRWRSTDSILAEIDELRGENYITVLHVTDDAFGVNGEWLQSFLTRLSDRDGERLTIQANLRADMVTENLCEAFRDYGVHRLLLRIAVEAGDEGYRREVLRKNVRNEDLFRAAGLFRTYGIPFTTYNMVGLPGETLEQALETLRLNVRLGPSMAICFVYQPYPGTALCDYALRSGVLTPEMLHQMGTAAYRGFYHSASVLSQQDIRKVENLQKVFGLVARYPFLLPVVEPTVRRERLSPILAWLYRLYVRERLWRRRVAYQY
jgi:anaerobic magnesium-protoporphyrin IX monomethyl ester cyclase